MDEPVCGKCGKVMTPRDSRIHPEMFLHDACLPDMLRENPFAHVVSPSCGGEHCRVCGKPATHKVGEETRQRRHNYTAYVCCECFGNIFGPMAQQWCQSAKQL